MSVSEGLERHDGPIEHRVAKRRGALRIESQGRARQDGNVGDWIEVENLRSRKLVTGRIGPDRCPASTDDDR